MPFHILHLLTPLSIGGSNTGRCISRPLGEDDPMVVSCSPGSGRLLEDLFAFGRRIDTQAFVELRTVFRQLLRKIALSLTYPWYDR